MNRATLLASLFALALLVSSGSAAGETWPDLPAVDGDISIPAQEWPRQPGPRTIKVYVRYPGGSLEGVKRGTGLMLSLHNWGGTDFRGAPDPAVLVSRYDVVAIGVDYLQSGPYDAAKDAPYDFGYFQALDALRALYFVWSGLETAEKPFDKCRIYATGGSGGGNVSLMVNKLAPRTFACIVDLCGMAKLAEDIAFGTQKRSHLNAGYNQDPKSDRYLSPDDQALRFVGHPEHAATMKALGNSAKIVVIHGVDDESCPVEDAREMVDNLRKAGLDIEAHFITKADLDGKALTSSGHPLGDRTLIVQRFADEFLLPPKDYYEQNCLDVRIVRQKPADFDSHDEKVRYKTPNGDFVVSYCSGFPVGRFEPNQK